MNESDYDILNYIIMEMAVKSGNSNVAHSILCERLYQKPTSPYPLDRLSGIYLKYKDYAKSKFYKIRSEDLGRTQGQISSFYQDITGEIDEW